MPARPPGRTGCADEQRNIADRPLSPPSLSLLVCLILSWVGLPRPAADSDKDGALSSSESWRASQEECWSPRGLWRSWKEVEIRHKARGRAGDRCRQAINETRITSHPNPLYAVAHNREKETIFGASLLSNKKPPTLHDGGYSRFKTVVL